jgi:hypothetical protein
VVTDTLAFSLSWAEQSDRHVPEDRSPQPLALWSAVAAVCVPPVNEMVKVYALHLTSVCCTLNRVIFSMSCCKHRDICDLEITHGKQVYDK